MKKIILFSTVIIALLAFKPTEQATWTVDKAHSKLNFTISHLSLSDVDGTFKIYDATITTTKEDFTDATVEMTADVSSVNTDNEKRDQDIKGPDYFDASKFPTIFFKSKSFKKIKENTYKVTGDLTMHGVTKAVSLDAIGKIGMNPMSKKTTGGFKVTGMIKRTDFGIATSTPAAMVGDEISLTANLAFEKN